MRKSQKPHPMTNLFGKKALENASRTAPGSWGQRRIGLKAMGSGLKPRTKPITNATRDLGNVKP